MGGFALCFYLGTALMRSVLHGPEAASRFLGNPDVKIGEGEFFWGMLLGVIGATVLVAYCQKVLVRFGVLSQQQVNDTWKE